MSNRGSGPLRQIVSGHPSTFLWKTHPPHRRERGSIPCSCVVLALRRRCPSMSTLLEVGNVSYMELRVFADLRVLDEVASFRLRLFGWSTMCSVQDHGMDRFPSRSPWRSPRSPCVRHLGVPSLALDERLRSLPNCSIRATLEQRFVHLCCPIPFAEFGMIDCPILILNNSNIPYNI